MPNTNKTLREEMLDVNTDRLTAYRTYDELKAACSGGWVPTLSKSSSAGVLARALEKDGIRVHWH